MQPLELLAAVAVGWGVVCFVCGFGAATLLRLFDENARLRAALSSATRPTSALPSDEWPVATSAAPLPRRTAPAIVNSLPALPSEPPPPPPGKVYLFGDPHAQAAAPPRRPATGSRLDGPDLLPRRSPHRREPLRRR